MGEVKRVAGGDDSIKIICGGTIGGCAVGVGRENVGKSGVQTALSGRLAGVLWAADGGVGASGGIEGGDCIKSVSLVAHLWLGGG